MSLPPAEPVLGPLTGAHAKADSTPALRLYEHTGFDVVRHREFVVTRTPP